MPIIKMKDHSTHLRYKSELKEKEREQEMVTKNDLSAS